MPDIPAPQPTVRQQIATVMSALEADRWSDDTEAAWNALNRAGHGMRLHHEIDGSDRWTEQNVKRLRAEYEWEKPAHAR